MTVTEKAQQLCAESIERKRVEEAVWCLKQISCLERELNKHYVRLAALDNKAEPREHDERGERFRID